MVRASASNDRKAGNPSWRVGAEEIPERGVVHFRLMAVHCDVEARVDPMHPVKITVAHGARIELPVVVKARIKILIGIALYQPADG
jgi:hypothetical protein